MTSHINKGMCSSGKRFQLTASGIIHYTLVMVCRVGHDLHTSLNRRQVGIGRIACLVHITHRSSGLAFSHRPYHVPKVKLMLEVGFLYRP